MTVWAGLAAEARAGTWRQGLQLGDHLGHVFGIDAADLTQSPHVAPGQQFQIVEQGAHGRIEAVALDQLQLQALRHRTRHDPGRLEAVADRQNRLDPRQATAQTVGDLGQFAAQIAALVDRVDQA
jgi:hypothetical protein